MIHAKAPIKDSKRDNFSLLETADQNKPSISTLANLLKNTRPNQFIELCSTLSNTHLLQLLNELQKLPPQSILSLFIVQYELPINHYTGLRELLFRYKNNDAVSIALLDLVNKIPEADQRLKLFLCFIDGYENQLIQIMRFGSATVIQKTLSIVFQLNPFYSHYLLTDVLVEYEKSEPNIATQITGNVSRVSRISFEGNSIDIAMTREEPQIAITVIQAFYDNKYINAIIKLNMLQKALRWNRETVIRFLLELPDFPINFIHIDTIKTRYPHISDHIVVLINAGSFLHAMRKTSRSDLPKTIKDIAVKIPSILHSRWSSENTLLHIATRNCHQDAISFLLSKNIPLNAVNQDGLTAFQIALNQGETSHAVLFVEQAKMQLRQAKSDDIWPLGSVIQYNQSVLTKISLTLLLEQPPETVCLTFAQALRTLTVSALHAAKMDGLVQSMKEIHPHQSLSEALSICCETSHHAIGSLLIATTSLLKTIDSPMLNQSIDVFLTQQLQVLQEFHFPDHQYAARIALIVFLFSQSIPSILSTLTRLNNSARSRIELEEILIQALTKPVIYSKLSYNDHKTLLTFFEQPSESYTRLISRQLNTPDLILFPTALLRDYANDSTFAFLHNASERHIHPLLIILALEKGLQDHFSNTTTQEQLRFALKQELVSLSKITPEKAIPQLKSILNLITHPDVKSFVQVCLCETSLQHIPAILLSKLAHDTQLDEQSLLWDIFLNFAENPRQCIESHNEPALIAFINQLSATFTRALISKYFPLLQEQETTFKHKLHACVMDGLLNNSQLESLLSLLVQWSIAYSPNTPACDVLIAQMPSLLETLPASAWIDVEEQLSDISNHYTASIKLLKDGLILKPEQTYSRLLAALSLLKDGFTARHDANIIFLTALLPCLKDTSQYVNNQLAIEAIVQILSSMTHTDQCDLINELPECFITHVVEHALSGMTSEDYHRATICKKLLTCLSYASTIDSKPHLTLIKKRLGQQDLNLLHDPQLIQIAQSILSTESASLEEETYQGVWIQRLITSIDFMSLTTPNTLDQLIERYRLLSLSLKQDEFDTLNRWILGRFSHAEHHAQALKRIQLTITQDASQRDRLIAKRQRLLEFRVDDSIRALFNQLEDTCIQLQDIQVEKSEKALNTLYTYYNQRLSGLRTDYLFKLSNFVFARARRGDVHMAQSTLMQWLSRYLPHQNFEQSELDRKKKIFLYDSMGKQIGFINESNKAFAFVNDEPQPLIDISGITPGMALYDDTRLRVGYLTEESDVQYENVFQKSTSALMIAKVPQAYLEQSPTALNLLLHDVLHHGEFDTLYHCPEMTEDETRQAWVTDQLDAQFIVASKKMSPDAMHRFVAFHSNESTLALLQKTQNAHNAALLFQSILEQPPKRTALFQQGISSFTAFLNRFKPVVIFKDFLIKNHQEPWFHDGLQLFLQAIPLKTKRTTLLLEALAMAGTHQDAIIHALIATQANARLLLTQFLTDEPCISIQNTRTSAIDTLTSYVSIAHVKSILPSINKVRQILTCAQYRLVLMAIDAHYDTLFPARELRLSKEGSWHAYDLIQLTRMVKRHWNEGQSIDKERAIGKRLLGELMLRTANFGQTHLFYTENGRFDVSMAQFNLSRHVISSLFARTLPQAFIEQIKTAFSSLDVTRWFEKNHENAHELSTFLEAEGALIDWRKMSDESWALSQDTKLPLISAFLLHYSGDVAPVEKLIQDFFDSSAFNLQRITQLLSIFPKRDISCLIFNILQVRVIKDPTLLDQTVLNHMAIFLSTKARLKKEASLVTQQLALIKFFGQQKQYDVVLTLCRLMNPPANLAKLIKQIKTEAWVERELAPFVNRWYFPILAFFKRGWHYWGKTPSPYIQYCDKTSTCVPFNKFPNIIRTTVLGGDEIESQRAQYQNLQRAKALKTRLNDASFAPKRAKCGLFSPIDDTVFNPIHSLFVPIEQASPTI